MKSLNKKISVVVLTGLAVTGSGLSQRFVAHAASSRLLNHNLLKNYNGMEMWDIDDYNAVKNGQENHKYDAIFLGKNSSKFISKIERSSDGQRLLITPKQGISKTYFLEHSSRYFFLKFKDDSDFLRRMKEEFNKYRLRNSSIIIQVGDCFFKVIFDVNEHERNTIPVKVLANEYDFNVEYAGENGWYGNIVTESHLYHRYDLKDNEQLRKKLEEKPKRKNVDVFDDVETFAISLKLELITIPRELTRYTIAGYDFILKSNK